MADDNAKDLPPEVVGFAEAMMAEGEDRKQRLEKAASDLQEEMEAAGHNIRQLVLAQPPTSLLGYLWSHFAMGMIRPATNDGDDTGDAKDLIKRFQFVLEYVHAVWSAHRGTFQDGQLDEAKAQELLGVCDKLSDTAMFYAMASSRIGTLAEFGDVTAEIEFQAKSAWILIRGHRYQVLEGEFFEFALGPHDEALRAAYGVGAADIATGMQKIADSIRVGYGDAMARLLARFEESKAKIANEGIALAEAIDQIRSADETFEADVGSALMDMFYGGICNVSKHTKLPEPLLQDMAYEPGAEETFFAEGPFNGTPLRTLPARIRPLIKLADGYYATDGQFVRDSAYRAIQRGLVARTPSYREGWNKNQKAMTETAFPKILAKQLAGAHIHEEVYFQDAKTGDWAETDLVGVIDDVLFVVEAKAGVMAMQSPATNFQSHIRTIRELVLKAYRQCSRFLEYLASGSDMPIFRLKDGRHEEVARISLSRMRQVFPIGLTVEAFTPFSAMCKVIPEVAPVLGKHAFVSMSVDDLFVLRRFLPSAGELFHYLEVRQALAGIPQATIFDEMDHLGAYIRRNRFDQDIRRQLETADRVAWDSFSDPIDRHFEGEEWANAPLPRQAYPRHVAALLDRLDRDRPKGWLSVDSETRNGDETTRNAIDALLGEAAKRLGEFPVRRMLFRLTRAVQIWLTAQLGQPTQAEIQRQGEIACLAAQMPSILVVRVQCQSSGEFLSATCVEVQAPSILRSDYAALKGEAETLLARKRASGGPQR